MIQIGPYRRNANQADANNDGGLKEVKSIKRNNFGICAPATISVESVSLLVVGVSKVAFAVVAPA